MEIVRVENLSKNYGTNENPVFALKNISLTINEGELVAITGTSGSGKSTLLHILGGIDYPSEGEVYIKGKKIFEMKEKERTEFRRTNIGLIYQFFNLLPILNVKENILLPVLLGGKTDAELPDTLLNDLGLKDRVSHLPSQLSGGQQQRVAIGRALITRPAIILADEPTGALDSHSSQMLLSAIQSINETLGATILMVTHDAFSASYANRILFLRDGTIFTEIFKGNNSRRTFFEKILDVLTMTGGGVSDVC